MPFDSNGNFTRTQNWTSDYENGIEIVCDRHDDEDDNFANGFNQTFCRDGRTVATGNFKMGNFKITGLADGQTSNDAVTKGQLDSVNSSLTNLSQNAVKISGEQKIDDVKTFTSSPIAPTLETSDSSDNVATTSFVHSVAEETFTSKVKPDVALLVDIKSQVSSSTGYTAPSNGFISLQTGSSGGNYELTIDGKTVAKVRQYSGDSHGDEYKQIFAIVGEGQVVKSNLAVSFGVFVPFS